MTELEEGRRDPDCVFCKIIAGEIPAHMVYEDDEVLAFDDVNPMMPVHTLIVPKRHYEHIGDGLDDAEMGHLFNAVSTVAAMKGIAESGYRVFVNTGDDAKQTVKHLHIHVMGGGPMTEGSPAER